MPKRAPPKARRATVRASLGDGRGGQPEGCPPVLRNVVDWFNGDPKRQSVYERRPRTSGVSSGEDLSGCTLLERALCCEDDATTRVVSKAPMRFEPGSTRDATTRVVSQAPMRSEPGSTTVVSQTPARSEPQLCRATNLDSLANGTGAYQQKPDENVITPDDQFSDPSRHRSKIYEPISSRSRLPFLKGAIGASKSDFFEDDLESCNDTESPALSFRERVRDEDAYHEGDCRLVPCSICPIEVVDRDTCVGGVSLRRGVVSPTWQALSSEEPSSTCSAAPASEHRFRGTDHDVTDESVRDQGCTGKRARTRLRQKRAKAQASTRDCLKGPVDCHAQADDRWIELPGDWPITRGSLGFSKEELIEATGKYEKYHGFYCDERYF